MFEIIFSFLTASIVASLFEWLTHKYILHGLGKNKNSWFHYHWIHHNTSRRNNFLDYEYKKKISDSWLIKREICAILGVLLLNSWVYLIWPMCYLFLIFFAVLYYFCHKYSHLNPEWSKKYLFWHWEHHMGSNQDSNWCVTNPLWDYVFKTRIKYKYDENNKAIRRK